MILIFQCPLCRGLNGNHLTGCPEAPEVERSCVVCDAPLEPTDYVLCVDCYQEHPGD